MIATLADVDDAVGIDDWQGALAAEDSTIIGRRQIFQPPNKRLFDFPVPGGCAETGSARDQSGSNAGVN